MVGKQNRRLNEQEFYAWAYGNLLANTTRGVLAEYIVATALGICDTKRVQWNQYDLEIDGAEKPGGADKPDGAGERERIGIEVRSAAYVQEWRQDRPSEIVFSIRRAQGWDARTNTRADRANRSAKVYVFCVLEGKDKNRMVTAIVLYLYVGQFLSKKRAADGVESFLDEVADRLAGSQVAGFDETRLAAGGRQAALGALRPHRQVHPDHLPRQTRPRRHQRHGRARPVQRCCSARRLGAV